MKRILVTGATGFIGKNIVEVLGNKYEIERPGSHELNLLNDEQVFEYLKRENFDVVIHSAKRDGIREKRVLTDHEILDDNLRMFFNLARSHMYFGKMLYFGSGAEYNKMKMHACVNESDLGRFIPSDSYGFSKYIMAQYTETTSNIFELCLFGVYGKYEAWEKRFISNNICRNLMGLPMTISQNAFFDYLYIDDLIKIIEWFIYSEPSFHRYNVCSGERIDLYTLTQIINICLNTNTEVIVSSEGLKMEYTGNNDRLKKEMEGFKICSFKESISDLCLYYKKIKDEIFIDK